MAAIERIVYQPYVRGRRGAVAPGTAVACRNVQEAERRAERAMNGNGKVIGVHIVRVIADEEAGDYSEPDFLATIGIVPAMPD
jgi:hypothetical protein